MSDFTPTDLEAIADLPAGEIHLWAIALDPPPAAVERLSIHLAADEKERAERFRFEQHRRRYVVGRGALRTILGRYLKVAPGEVQFAYGPRGKPFLDDEHHLCFNLSNSHELAMAGFVRGIEIGVDVEHLRPVANLEQLAVRFFSASEVAALRELPRADQIAGFFNCWTRKEAYLKAVGEGLAARLDSFAVTLRPGEAARMVTLQGDEQMARAWSFAAFEPAAGYVGAIAMEAPLPAVRKMFLSLRA